MTSIKNISIPNPCQQSWQNMTPNGPGRHCDSCAKIVVDFSTMSTDEIIGYLAINQNTCGRFVEDQLETINWQLNKVNRRGVSQFSKWGLAIGLLSSLGYFRATAQVKEQTVHVSDSTTINRGFPLGKILMVPTKITITGNVTDEQGQPIPGAHVSDISGAEKVTTNVYGKFTITLPDNADKIKIAYVGYETQTLVIDRTSIKFLEIKLQSSSTWLGEVVVVSKPSTFKRITRWLHYKLLH